MSDVLKILVEASLNMGKSIKNINAEISAIAKNPSLKSIPLKIDIDKSFTSTIKSFLDATNKLGIAIKEQNRVVNETKEVFKQADGTIKEYNTSVLKNGEIIKSTKIVHDANKKAVNDESKSMQDQIRTLKQLEKELDGYSLAKTKANKNKLGEVTSSTNTYKDNSGQQVTVKLDRQGNVKNFDEVNEILKQQQAVMRASEAIDRAHYEALKTNQQRIEAMDKLHYRALEENRKIDLKNLEQTLKAKESMERAHYNALKTNNERDIAREKQHALALQQNAKRDADFSYSKQNLGIKIDDNIRRFGSNTDTAKALTELKGKLDSIKTSAGNYKNALRDIEMENKKLVSSLDTAHSHIESFREAMIRAAQKFPIWLGASSVVLGVVRGFKEMVDVIIEVDTQMTAMKRVMDESTNFDEIFKGGVEIADEFGRSLKEVNENMIGFSKQGFNQEQTLGLAKTATLMQNISDLTPDEAVNTLTTAMVVFNVEADKTIDVANKLNEVDNNYAVSTQGLAQSINKAGASAKAFGIDLDHLVGNTTAIAAATRASGNEVGNSLKTIYSRLTTLQNSEQILANAGVQMRGLNGEVRKGQDIIADLAGNWNKLSKAEQQNTGVKLAGRNQLNKFLALMQNYQMSIDATETSVNSQGSAMRENARYMESLQAQINGMKSAWEEFSVAMGKAFVSDAIKLVTGALSTLAHVLESAVNNFGALPVVVGVAYVSINLLSAGFRALVFNMASTVAGMFGVTASAAATSVGFKGLGAAIKATGITLKGFLASTGVGLLLVALSLILEKVTTSLMDTSDAIDETGDKLEELSNKRADLSQLKEMSVTYEELSKKTSLTTDEKLKLAKAEEQLQSKHGVIIDTTNTQTDAIEKNTQAIKDRTVALEAEIKAEATKAKLEFQADQGNINKQINNEKDNWQKRKQAYEEATKKQAEYFRNIQNGVSMKNTNMKWSMDGAPDEVFDPNSKDTQMQKRVAKIGELLSKAVLDSKTKFDEANNSFIGATNKKKKALEAEFNEYIDSQEQSGVKIKATTRKLAEAFAAVKSKSGENVGQDEFKTVFEAFQAEDITNLDQAIKKLEDFNGVGGLTHAVLKDLQTYFNQLGISTFTDDMSGASDTVSGFSDDIKEAKSNIEPLNKALLELEKGNALTSDSILDLIANNKDLADKVKLVNGKLSLSKEAILEVRDASIISANKTSQLRVQELKAEQDALKEKLEIYTKQVLGMQHVTNAKEALVQRSKELDAEMNNKDTNIFERIWAGAQKAIIDKKLNEYNEQNKKMQDEVDSLNKLMEGTSNSLKDLGSETDKTKDSFKRTTEVIADAQKKIDSLNDSIKKLQNQYSRLPKSSKQYQDALKKEILLQEQLKRLAEDKAKNPQKYMSIKTTTTYEGNEEDYDGSSGGGSGVGSMLDAAKKLSATQNFTYKQIKGEYKGTYEQFTKNAVSDCSQFVQEMFKEFMDVKLPRTAAEQAKVGTAVSKDNLRPGDLVFFNTTGKANSHVGIYSGNGKFMQMGNSGMNEQSLSGNWAKQYQGARRITSNAVTTSQSSAKVSGKYSDLINKYASVNNVSPDIIKAIIQQESGFNAKIVSKAGAQGLMQLMPATAKGLGVKNAFDPAQNIAGGTKYFAQLLKKYNNDVELALMAYNGGSGRIDKWIASGKSISLPKETREYAGKVLKNVSSSSIDAPVMKVKTEGYTEKELADKAREGQDEAIDHDNAKYKLQLDLLDSFNLAFENKLNEQDNIIKKSQNNQARYAEDSKQYIAEDEKQIKAMLKQREIRHNQKVAQEKYMKDNKLQGDDQVKQLAEYSSQFDELTLQIAEKRAAIVNSTIAGFTRQSEELGNQVDISKAKLEGLDETSKEYREEVQKQIPLINQQIEVNKKAIEYMEQQLKNNQLDAKTKDDLTKHTRELTIENLNLANSIAEIIKNQKKQREDAADKIIEAYKKQIEKQKDIALKAYDDQKNAEDKRHDQVVSNLDDETKRFEDMINARLKAMNRSDDADDYEKELKKKLDERQKLQDRFNKELLDNSFEAKARRKDLQEQIDAKNEEIDKFKLDRERTLRQENLSDQLEDRKKYLDKSKDAEDKTHNSIVNKIDEEKRKTEQKYDDMLEDEKRFYDMKQKLISNDTAVVKGALDDIKGEYGKLFDFLKSQVLETSEQMSNLQNSLNTDLDNINKFPMPIDTPISGGSGKGSGNGNQKADWEKYLSNKQQAENISKQVVQLQREKKPDSSKIKNLQAQFQSLKKENDAMRSKWGFPDGNYDYLKGIKPFSAETGGMTPANMPKEGQFLLAHQKELILNKSDTTNLIKVVDVTRSIIDKLSGGFDVSKVSPVTNNTKNDNSHSSSVTNVNITLQGGKNIKSDANTIVETLRNNGIRSTIR